MLLFTFSFLSSVRSDADVNIVNRLLGGEEKPANDFALYSDGSLGERRRTSGSEFGLDADMICTSTTYTWVEDWSYYAGTMYFSAPYLSPTVKYVLRTTDAAATAGKEITGIWWPWTDGLTPESSTDSAGKTIWILTPTDDDEQNLDHYMNLGLGAHWTDVMPKPASHEVDLFYCYDPTPAPTPNPTAKPTFDPTNSPTLQPTPDPTKAISITDGKLLMDSDNHLAETVVNIAAFLAQTSWESAKYTACDENNHSGKVNAACTQRSDGALYQDVNTGPHSCALDATMTITATTSASWTIGPLECRPDPPVEDRPDGWKSVENCCWWGRGSIQTTGPTNYGALQHDVIAQRADNTLDLCTDPGLLCTEDDLKWTAGVYYWVKQVQQASCFVDALVAYVDDYDVDATPTETNPDCNPFAEGVGGVVNNGAWNAHAHGDHVDAAGKEVSSNGVDGRVPRFVKFMSTLKTKIQAYQDDDDHTDDATPPSCTGNTAVDFILNAANVESLAEINGASSVYSWSGLCTALKEFI